MVPHSCADAGLKWAFPFLLSSVFVCFGRVDVLYNRFTPDECMVLNEMLRCATPEQRASVPRVATIKGGEHYRRLHESDSDEDEYDSEDYETDDGMDVDEETE